MEDFVRCYEAGLTPNPCVRCNRWLKFGKLLDRAAELECDKIVTGHYAKIEKDTETYLLKKAEDRKKDQSYMLYRLSQEQLGKSRFPLGTYKKTEIREMAEAWGFVNARKKDSQDICFVPDGDYARVIEEYTKEGSRPGPFIDEDGRIYLYVSRDQVDKESSVFGMELDKDMVTVLSVTEKPLVKPSQEWENPTAGNTWNEAPFI